MWVSDEGKDQSYPAKATVAAAVGYLPQGRTFSAKEFLIGFGEAQSFACLKALGYRILRREGAKGSDGPFSRDKIEAAMDAFDQFRASGAHADVFSGFEEPSVYWVRSSKPRTDKRFPTKPVIGFILGKHAKAPTGGWSQPHDAAARLHAAGYIIVDQSDEPLPLPEQYTHLMRGAERARFVALNFFIAPAREAGVALVTIRAGDLHDMSGGAATTSVFMIRTQQADVRLTDFTLNQDRLDLSDWPMLRAASRLGFYSDSTSGTISHRGYKVTLTAPMDRSLSLIDLFPNGPEGPARVTFRCLASPLPHSGNSRSTRPTHPMQGLSPW